ncbi:hypothetical protein TW95_gp0900 [Pandoravirus inopinatum]|uniref:Transmembrane protein n=1 Tax=Pandoravirus inopinatum TaxID=1605721 RepID=A0A0B5J259_9VIRU|nr:hypothetical protein TW95_gp0900 [Pandoravirus inopinatum]AJF97634.1 hypothetical protein [Pandoravirus inopinatum]
MQTQIEDSGSLDAPTTPPLAATVLSTYDGVGQCQCPRCCAVRTPAPSYIDWDPLWDVINRVASTTAAGINRCVKTVAAAAPYALGFYGASMAIKAGVVALASRKSWLQCAVDLKPLCYGHLGGLAAVCAAAYAVGAAARKRERQRLPTGLVGLASRVMHMSAALGMAACSLGSLAYHLAHSTTLRDRWTYKAIDTLYERGMVDGIMLCGAVAIVVASAVIVFQSPCKVVTDMRRALAEVIDVDPVLTLDYEPRRRRPSTDLDDLLLPLPDADQAEPDDVDPEAEQAQS